MRYKAPDNFRELIALFGAHGTDISLEAMIESLDFRESTTHQFYYAILGRFPESVENVLGWREDNVSQSFLSMLLSEEFQSTIIRSVLRSFADKQRMLFVHIPKCAGTDLESDLSDMFPAMPYTMEYSNITNKEVLFKMLAKLSVDLNLSKGIFVCGHIPLNWYIDHGLIRYNDKIFTIIREPTEIILSHINYIVTVLRSDPELTRQDVCEWLRALEMDNVPVDFSEADWVALGRKILVNAKLIQRNYLCSFLGSGSAASAIDPLARSNIEIAFFDAYHEWRREAWGLPVGSHRNASERYLKLEDLTEDERAYLTEIVREDSILYGAICAVRPDRAASVTGVDVAKYMAAPDFRA